MRALVVDDSLSIRRYIRKGLVERLGFTVVEAEDVGQALDILHREQAFDLVMTDLVLPGSSGLSLVRRLRARDPAERPVILVVSAQMDERFTMEDVVDAGATSFLSKPFTHDTLIEKVRSLMPQKLVT